MENHTQGTDDTTPLLSPVSANQSTSRRKLKHLDGVRGVACMIVLFDHWITMGFQQGPTSEPYPLDSVFWRPWLFHTPLRVLVAGEFAVALFFVLSGYVLLRQAYHRPWDNRKVLLRSALARWPRLWLPTTFASLLYYAWLHFGPFEGGMTCHNVGDVDQYAIVLHPNASAVSAGEMLLNVAVGQWTYDSALYTITWTLQVELIVSFVVYLGAIALTSSRARQNFGGRVVAYTVLVIVLPVTAAAGVAIPRMVQYLPPFLVGGFLCMIEEWQDEATVGVSESAVVNEPGQCDPIGRPLDRLRRFTASQPVAGTLCHVVLWAIALYCGSTPVFVKLCGGGNITIGQFNGCPNCPDPTECSCAACDNNSGTLWEPLSPVFGWWWITVGAAAVMISIITSRFLQRVLICRPIAFLGRVSFGVYLLHYQILIAADTLIVRPLLKTHSMSRDGAMGVSLLAILPTTLVLAHLFTENVDAMAVQAARSIAAAMVGHSENKEHVHQCATRKVFAWIGVYAVLVAICFIPGPHENATCQASSY
eukprot:m.58141 g.58141  ORF g.58141 m.58141 type:complete len:535 (+) comp9394_c0_seq1:176-1780(+)